MGYIIGISAFFHDSGIAIIDQKGRCIFASHEERFSRKKHDERFPINCLKFAKNKFDITYEDIETVCFYEKPALKLIRNLETVLHDAPHGFDHFDGFLNSLSGSNRGNRNDLQRLLAQIWPNFSSSNKIKFSQHHLSHAASAFFNSPFNNAAILTIDGVGENQTATIMQGEQAEISHLYSLEYPNSIGLFYSAITAFCGMKPNSGEYKLMGLAPFGQPVYADILKEKIISIDKNSLEVKIKNTSINLSAPVEVTISKLEKLLGIKRVTNEEIKECHADLAAATQVVLNEAVEILALKAKQLTNSSNLVMAGGVALNCVANSFLAKQKDIFDSIWVFPAAGDCGAALGAAQAYFYAKNNKNLKNKSWFNPYLGPDYTNKEIEEQLNSCGAVYYRPAPDITDSTSKIATILRENGAGGILIGKSEFGPRALGARSIIGLASDKTAQIRLNLKTKFRESFRPFAPLLFEDDLDKYFSTDGYSKIFLDYMLFTIPLKENQIIPVKNIANRGDFGEIIGMCRSTLPAITHVDYSARVQTIGKNNPKKIREFFCSLKEKTGEDVFINTSFNVRGEPIVESPIDAFSAFMRTDLDFLYIDGYLLLKNEQKAERAAFVQNFERD